MSSNTMTSSWQAIKLVGKGGSSVVYKARLTDSGQIVAVKQIDTDGLSKDQIAAFKGEIETIRELHHPNIISYYGTQQTTNKINIFLEYADRGSLRQFYRKKGRMSETQVINCTRQILNGLKYLHEKGIAHRDIKCANCLLTQKGIVKLADFGASKRFESESLVSGLKGTPNWMAPEVIKGTQMTSGWLKADVWSVGCTIVEMLTSLMPFSEYDNPMTAMYHIANGKAPNLDNISCSSQMKEFINICCDPNPSSRPTVDTLLSYPFLQKNGDQSPPKTINHATISTSMSVDSQSLSSIKHHSDERHHRKHNATVTVEEDEVLEELENDYARELFDEEESVEDETEAISQDNIPIIYSEESSHVSDANISFLSEVNQDTPPRGKCQYLSLKDSMSPSTNSGSFNESSSSHQSRKGFPRPHRLSDHLAKGSLSPKLQSLSSATSTASSSSSSLFSGENNHMYSLSAPASRINTATGSLESSPRAKNRQALASLSSAEQLSEKLLSMTHDLQSLDLDTNHLFSQMTYESRPTAPLSGEIHRIQNRRQESLSLNGEMLSNVGSGRTVSLPRSIPKDLSKSQSSSSMTWMMTNATTTLQRTDSSKRIQLSSSTSSSMKSSSTSSMKSSHSSSSTVKPRRRVDSLAKQRSKSAGIDTESSSTSPSLIGLNGRPALPPVTSYSSSSSSTSSYNAARDIQSAPLVMRSNSNSNCLPPISSEKPSTMATIPAIMKL